MIATIDLRFFMAIWKSKHRSMTKVTPIWIKKLETLS